MFQTKDKNSFIHVLILYMSSLIFIANINILENIYIYTATVYSILFLLTLNYNTLHTNFRKLDDSYDRILFSLFITFGLYLMLNALIVDPVKFYYIPLKFLPYIVFMVLVIRFKSQEELRNKINTVVVKILSATMVLALIFFLMGYSNVFLSMNNVISLISNEHFLIEFGEYRLQWMSTHKSRFAAYALLCLLFILSFDRYKSLTKLILVVLIFINIYFSSSIIFLVLSLLLVFIHLGLIVTGKIKKDKYFLGFIISTFFTIAVILISVIYYIIYLKDIVITLADRVYIWSGSFTFIIDNPWGIVLRNKDLVIPLNERYLFVNNAHNIILNEGIESGIIGMTIFTLILALILYRLKQNVFSFYGVLFFFIGGLFDMILYENMNYIFWFLLALLYSKPKKGESYNN